jgi:abortive infection bacteriophage resistance protein
MLVEPTRRPRTLTWVEHRSGKGLASRAQLNYLLEQHTRHASGRSIGYAHLAGIFLPRIRANMAEPDLRIEYGKPPLTFEEQLEKLSQRGMSVGDVEAAARTLSRISYYRLSAYWHPFRLSPEADSFKPGSQFEDAVRLYEFDRRLRLLLMAGIERVEVTARTAITYVLAHEFGAFAHAEPAAFKPEFDHSEWCNKLDQEVIHACEQTPFLSHFKRRYQGFPRVPIWMATEVLSFGRLSKLCRSGLNEAQIRGVSDHLGVHPSLLSSWLQALSTVRNICAHHGRLWNRHMGISPKLPKNNEAWTGVHKSRVYASILMVRRLLQPIDDGVWWAGAAQLIAEADQGMKNAMSVPDDWRTRPPP